MAKGSDQKVNAKKVGKSLKEKRAAKKAKSSDSSSSAIPKTGH